MELRQLAHFVAAVEHGNIVRAADAVHLTQPALTKSIQKLEAALGVTLLARTPRGVSPTPFGEILLRYARLMRTQGERAVAEIAAVKAGRRGHLALGVGMSFLGYLLPAVVAEVLDAHPGLRSPSSTGATTRSSRASSTGSWMPC
jgi:DNA-binding transcriptional LysR family regulator